MRYALACLCLIVSGCDLLGADGTDAPCPDGAHVDEYDALPEHCHGVTLPWVGPVMVNAGG